MSMIQVNNITFGYEGSYDMVFENVTFQMDTDWKLGLIGRNGKGKTTLLQLLMGNYEYQGKIISPVSFSYFPYGIKDKSLDTIEVVDQINPNYEFWELQRELSYLEVSTEVLYRPFDTLSNGEQTKIMLAILFLKENQFLLIDEPTNHLDRNARKIVGNYLASKKGFILVSHDRTLLDECTDHILAINKDTVEVQRGNFTSWQKNKELRDHYELSENDKLKKEIRKLSEAAKRTADWSDHTEDAKYHNGPVDRGYIGHKAAKMMKRSKSIETRQQGKVEEKSKLLKNIDSADSLTLFPLKYHKEVLLEARNLNLYYGSNRVVKDADFALSRGERIALCGKNGSGKSSILKLLLGEDISYEGELSMGTNIILSYVAQDSSYLKGNLTEYARRQEIDESLLKAVLRKLDFSREQFDKDMEDFSLGQKKKVQIAASLCKKAHLYLWDEALNYIDVLSRIQIEELILKFQPTMIFVEHDQTFMEHVATKIVELA